MHEGTRERARDLFLFKFSPILKYSPTSRQCYQTMARGTNIPVTRHVAYVS